MSKYNLGDTIRNLEAIFYNMFCGIIVIITYILSGSRMQLLQTILEVSSKLSLESYQKLSRLVHAKDILSIIFLIVQTTLFLYGACFKSINDNLAYMQILMTNDTQPRGSSSICHMPRNQFLLTELKILMKWHLMVSNTVKTLNIIFSLQILAIIIMSICNVTFQVYFRVVRWKDGIYINFDIYFVDALLTAIGYYVINIILLMWACETVKNQAQEISTTVHDALNSTNNEQIKKELQLFSLQILHHENIFSVKSLTVDAKLLAAMAGNITTHLLILIQFLNASHSCDTRTINNN
ncbi:PREDICTED: uncharacterized protein LOC105569147 [Vollenhovia emeryi]|uniref:uncharacterized protein LOC105569147 n=1 Tax=Vollenhovia emeryi TaxID=411798 RepID=UPI0005F4B630|nr:PREDICTED: uncharacterized protein LOC105569147 [Vollenhovia emeryi]